MKLMIGTNKSLQDTGIFLLRIFVGVILFAAGAGKVFGWFGGQGLEATIQGFVNYMHIPAFLGYVSTFTELLGGLLLILGLITRPAAFAVFINMLVAGIVSLPKGFLIGAAYPFSLMSMALVILLIGPMGISLDAILFGNCKQKENNIEPAEK